MTRILKTCVGSGIVLSILALGSCGPMETRTTTTERTTIIAAPAQTSTTTTTSVRQTTP